MQNAQIAFHIKSLCIERNISINQLFRDCKIRKGLIYDLEKRDYTPSVKAVSDIADYFGVSIDYLVGRTDNPEMNR